MGFCFALKTHGEVVIALLCRMKDFSKQEAEDYARQFLHLLDAMFEEYRFELVTADQIPSLLEPFEIHDVKEITRRCEFVLLDTLRPEMRRQKKLGFDAPEPVIPKSGIPENAIVYLFPFLRSESDFKHIFCFLLYETHPVAISCTLRPTSLPPDAAKVLEDQITRCERYAQVPLDRAPREIHDIYPTLQEQARVYQRQLTRALLGLRDNAAVLQLRVASTQVVSQLIVDSVGSLVTAPAGGTRYGNALDFSQYLSGGYEALSLHETSLQKAKQGLSSLEIECSTHPLLPNEGQPLLYLFDSIEAASPFCLPSCQTETLPGIEVRHWRIKEATANLSQEGTVIGVSETRKGMQSVRINQSDRRLHMYVVGKTGTGKSTLLKTMILSDMAEGEGLAVVDPHGDLFDELIGSIPSDRSDDVVILNPMDLDYPVGLNLLECTDRGQRYFVAREMRAIMERLLRDQYLHEAVEYAGPVFYQHLQMNMLLAMSNPEDPGTLLEFYEIFQHKEFWKRWMPIKWHDHQLERWVKINLPNVDYTKRYSEGTTWGDYLSSKFDDFVFDPKLRLIFGQKRSTIDLRKIMDEGKILLVNLRKGELAESNARFLGMILMAKILQTAMQRTRIPPEKRRLFHLYVDEFQSLATESFVLLMSEARKFGISLILANQFISQIKDERITQSVFGNVGTVISFRVGHEDAETLAPHFAPVFNSHDLTNLPNWTACMKTTLNGQTIAPFSVMTILPERQPDARVGQTVLQNSQKKHGRHRRDVEKEIDVSLWWDQAK